MQKIIDTQLQPQDRDSARTGRFWGYVAPFYRRGVVAPFHYFAPDTEIEFQPLFRKDDDGSEVSPVLYEHNAAEDHRLGYVTQWGRDMHGIMVTLQLMPWPGVDLVRPLLAA